MSKDKGAGKYEECLGQSKSFGLVERRLFKFKKQRKIKLNHKRVRKKK